ncbi:MAG: Lrp/AsnC family transcriptional regulator [Deltaproteobacteria bacterium]|nr:Lrp/AsnC family transcriptional regulator [Deltaproteobacteria bacterium]
MHTYEKLPEPRLDETDRKILNRIQGDFPISRDPFGEVGKEAGVAGDEALRRVLALIDRGIIRKVGPFFDAKKLDYASTLCAMEVPGERIYDAVKVINAFPQVTHNYLRKGKPNVWFTLIAESRESIDAIIAEITDKCGAPVKNLPALKVFKIKVDLKLDDKD